MPAPKGNQSWKFRKTHGAPRLFSEPEELWQACVGYFDWVEANSLREEKLFHSNGEITRATVAKMRPMTKTGLCLHLQISPKTWEIYKGRDEFTNVCETVESTIWEQKFSGAAAELLNSNIIARELGLRDESRHEHTGPGGKDLPAIKVVFE